MGLSPPKSLLFLENTGLKGHILGIVHAVSIKNNNFARTNLY